MSKKMLQGHLSLVILGLENKWFKNTNKPLP